MQEVVGQAGCGRPRFTLTFAEYCQKPPGMNATLQEEKEYLEEIKEKLTLAIRRIDGSVKQYSAKVSVNLGLPQPACPTTSCTHCEPGCGTVPGSACQNHSPTGSPPTPGAGAAQWPPWPLPEYQTHSGPSYILLKADQLAGGSSIFVASHGYSTSPWLVPKKTKPWLRNGQIFNEKFCRILL